jgi:5-oxoprolinase (ATP-hydrolysing) subunit C
LTAVLTITRAGPLATVQDAGRFNMLSHGISASGPMDRSAYGWAASLLNGAAPGGLEFTAAGLDLVVESGACSIGMAGGVFTAHRNGERLDWPARVKLGAGDALTITPGAAGNYGYLRFDASPDVPRVLGSIATNSRAQLGGFGGRALRAGDRLKLVPRSSREEGKIIREAPTGPIRVIWALHAELFASSVRQRFVSTDFSISSRLDRMGVRLDDGGRVFADSTILSLVSDAIVPGDIQILGDGTPIVLMRDHQPTGGYPRIATIISADLDRFAQMRPGTPVGFRSVTLDHAHKLLRSTSP